MIAIAPILPITLIIVEERENSTMQVQAVAKSISFPNTMYNDSVINSVKDIDPLFDIPMKQIRNPFFLISATSPFFSATIASIYGCSQP